MAPNPCSSRSLSAEGARHIVLKEVGYVGCEGAFHIVRKIARARLGIDMSQVGPFRQNFALRRGIFLRTVRLYPTKLSELMRTQIVLPVRTLNLQTGPLLLWRAMVVLARRSIA